MQSRIDYLRFWLPYDAQERVDAMNEYEEIAYDVLKQHNIPGKPYARTTFYSRSKKRVDSSWQIWGVAADLFLRECTPVMLKKLTRIDYRGVFNNQDLDFDSLFTMLKRKHKGKMNVNQISSPVRRSKGPHRDNGGEGIIVGAPDSLKRLTIYQRASEGPHMETQFSHEMAQRIVLNAFPAGEMAAPTVYDSVFQAAEHFFTLIVKERTGFTPEELDAHTEEFSDRASFRDPEYMLSQAEMIFDSLPDDAKAAFRASVGADATIQDVRYALVEMPDILIDDNGKYTLADEFAEDEEYEESPEVEPYDEFDVDDYDPLHHGLDL